MGEKNYEVRDVPSDAERHPKKDRNVQGKLGAMALKNTIKK